MHRLSRNGFCLAVLFSLMLRISVAQAPLTPEQIVERSSPVVAQVIVSHASGETGSTYGSAVVIRSNGVLLTAYHVVKGAYALQVRFKNGEVYDDVQLLSVDARRDVAAIRIPAANLPVLQAATDEAKPGQAVTTISNADGLPWSTSTGVVSAYRVADEVPGAGRGYRLIQFTASSSPGSSGGALIDAQGKVLGLIVGSLQSGQNVNFAVPFSSVDGLAEGAPSKSFASGATLVAPAAAIAPRPVAASPTAPQNNAPHQVAVNANPGAAEQSDLLNTSKDRDFILHNFRTMYVDASNAEYFGSDQMKAALGGNRGFAALNIRIVDDPHLADTVLKVGYTFAWDYPFELKHQNTSMVLEAGKGSGPFSGPAGAASVASQFVKAMKPYRVPAKK